MYYQNPDGTSVHDGFPNPAADSSLQTLDLNQLLIKNPISTFFVRNALGDVLLVDRSLAPHANDLVLWVSEGELRTSAHHAVQENAEVWGVITTTIRQHKRPKS